jgi:MFS family permease
MDHPTASKDVAGTTAPAGHPESELQRRRWYALFIISIGSFMTPFDASIVAVALPAMGADIHLSYSQGLWAQAAYLLVTSVLLIPAGRVADSRGPARYYLLGTVIFAIGSAVAAFAVGGTSLILGRCVQGVGGAFVFSTAPAIVTAAFPPKERGRAIGLNTMVVYLGLTLGPVIGGLIVTHVSWRWVFLINVPIALVALVLGWTLIGIERRDRQLVRGFARSRAPLSAGPEATSAGAEAISARAEAFAAGTEPSVQPSRHVDILGAVLLGGGLAALLVPLTFSPLWGWSDGKTIGLLAAAVLLLAAFVVAEDRVAEPMLDLDLLRKNRVFASANAAVLIAYVGVFGVTTLTAVYLEIVQGRSAQEAGLLLLAQPVVMAVLSPFTGRLSDRVGSRGLAALGLMVITGGMVQLAFTSTSTGRVLLALATVGLGMALFSSPNISAIMGSVERSQLGLASGFQSTMRFTGQGISMAVLGAIAAYQLGAEGARIIFLGEAGSPASAAAFGEGFEVAMLVGAALTLVGAVISWTARPARRLSD